MRWFLIAFLVTHSAFAKLDSCKVVRWYKAKRDSVAAKYDHYSQRSFSMNQSQLQDHAMSSLIYGSLGLGAEWAGIWTGENSILRSRFRLNYYPMGRGAALFFLHNGDISYRVEYLRKVKSNKRWNFYAGGTAANQLNLRYHLSLGNNAFALDNKLGLQLKGRAELTPTEGGRRTWFTELDYGVFGYAWRYPLYAYGSTDEFFTYPGKLNAFSLEIGFFRNYRYSEENRYQLSYSFEYYQLHGSVADRPVAQYQNSLKFVYWLKVY